jgi:hypothetical protein
VKLIIKVLIISLIILLLGYLIGNTTTVRAEDRVKTLQSEIIRLSTKYKVDSKLVSKIIKCESSMYSSAINENIGKDGKVWSRDYGLMQVNDYYHEADMKKLGLDIYNGYDSLEYGIILLANKGTKPWSASKFCWNK